MRLALLIGVSVASGLIVRRQVIVIKVVGKSMSPTFDSGQRVIATRLRRHIPQRGEVIVFETPAHRLAGSPALRVKRVVACAGDPIPAWLEQKGEDNQVVPANCFVVAGDTDVSEDSRQLGLIALAAIKAVVRAG